MIQRFVFLALLHLSSALFERCDEAFALETDDNLTIKSRSTLNARNVSSCRYAIVAPVNYIVDVSCTLQIDQPDSQKCPLKRFFVSVDGINDLRGADYFCSRSGNNRTVRRRSVMNRLVLAFATQVDVGTESFTCVARRIASRCECGWARRVGKQIFFSLITSETLNLTGANLQRRGCENSRVSVHDGTHSAVYQPRFLWSCDYKRAMGANKCALLQWRHLCRYQQRRCFCWRTRFEFIERDNLHGIVRARKVFAPQKLFTVRPCPGFRHRVGENG